MQAWFQREGRLNNMGVALDGPNSIGIALEGRGRGHPA